MAIRPPDRTALAMVGAVRAVADAVAILAPPEDPRGYQSRLERIPGLATALRFCRFRDGDGAWHGLAELMKRVPAEHVARACTVGRGPECWVVSCVCGARAFVGAGLVECRGGCNRWFVSDESGVWAARLPEQEADDAE